jgi:hypothetical protein
LLIQLEGENTDSIYVEASAALSVEVSGRSQELEIRNGFVWRLTNSNGHPICALEVPESGVKQSRGEVLRFSGSMPPSVKGAMTLKVPLQRLESAEAREQVQDLDFDRALQRERKASNLVAEATGGLRLILERELADVARPKSEATSRPVGSIPEWFPKAPPLPAPQGPVLHVGTVEELLKASEALGPGGTILLANGQYRLPRVLVLDEKRNVTIRSASGDPAKVTLSGQGWDSGSERDDILHIAHCGGVTIADLTFYDCRSYGIKVVAEHGPSDIAIYNCRFKDIGIRALKGSAGKDPDVRAIKGSVRYCVFENTRVPPSDWLFGGDYISAIDLMALEDWTISDNFFRNIKGRNGGGRAAIFVWVRSRRITVERNLIVDCDRGIAFGNPGQSTANTGEEMLHYVSQGMIRNNMITGGPDCGIELWHSQDIAVLHNSIWRPAQNWKRGIRIGAGTTRAEIRNNLIHGEVSVEGGQAEMAGNLTGNLDGYFTDVLSGDLALTARAVGAIDQGEPLPQVPKDIRGQGRRGKPDLGAWEFAP